MKANPSAPEGLALQGASAALRGLAVESATARAARLASAPCRANATHGEYSDRPPAVPRRLVVIVSMIVVVIMTMVVMFVVRLVFGRAHKVHRPIAGIVFATVLAPILRVSGRHVQINGCQLHRLRLDHHGLRVHHRRPGFIAQLDLTVHTRGDFAGKHDVETQIAGGANTATREQHGKHRSYERQTQIDPQDLIETRV